MSKLFNNLFGPIDSVSGGDTLHPASAMDLLEELSKDEPETIPLTDKKDDDKTDDEDTDKTLDTKDTKDDDEELEIKDDEKDDDLDELEKELKGPDEKQLELMTPARRKDILAKYPKVFKDFPYLETAYYRDQKFTEIFPTIKEAELAATELKEYNELNNRLKNGDIESVVTNIKSDEKAFHRMVDSYLPTLAKVSPDAYHHIVGNLIKHTVQEMFADGESKENDSLKTAATILHNFVFGNVKWTPPTQLSKSVNPEENKGETELARKEREFNERRFTTAQEDIAGRVDNAIKATILQNIDPKEQMTDYIKNTAVKEALSNLENLLNKDTRFKALLDKLWQNAADKDFSKVELDKIKAACISKARTLLPATIKSARNNALKGMGMRVREEKQDADTPARRDSAPSKDSRQSRSDKSAPQPGESSLDFLSRD